MTTRPLTERQKDVLRFIARHIDRLGFQPSLREISSHFGWASPVAARHHLLAIQEKGVLIINAKEPRAIQFKWKLWIRRRGK